MNALQHAIAADAILDRELGESLPSRLELELGGPATAAVELAVAHALASIALSLAELNRLERTAA